MNIFILVCNICIPIIMIIIGVLYRVNSFKKINTIFDLIIPTSMFFSGFGEKMSSCNTKDDSVFHEANKRCGSLWIYSGIIILMGTVLLLVLNKFQIDLMFLDSLVEIECSLMVIIFITIEIFIKRKLYKKVMLK